MRTGQFLLALTMASALFLGVLVACGQAVSVHASTAAWPAAFAATPRPAPPEITSTLAISPTRAATGTETPAAKKGGVWVNHTAENPLVNALAVEGDYVWTATNGDGVVRWSRADGSFVRYTTADGLVHNTVRAVAIDPAGHKWFGTERGISEFDGRTWTTYTTTQGLAADKVVGIAVDPAGRKWFATWGGGVSEFDGRQWTTHTRAGGLPSNDVHIVAVDRRGHVWVGTPNGVGEFDGRRWRTYTTADGLIDAWVHAIVVDEAGRIWFGAPGGVSEYDGQVWRTFSAADGLLSDHVHAIAADKAGRVWFATPIGVSSFDGRQWTGYAAASGLPRSRVTAVAVDEAGHPWLGAVDGLMGFDGRAWRMYTTGSLASNRVNAIAVDETGHEWFFTDKGASEFDGHAWTTYTSADGLASNQVNAVALDEAGRTWFGTDAGVSEYDGRTWTTYAITQGLAGNRVRAITIDASQNKWFATDQGASRFDGRMWATYTISQGLASNDVRTIAIDGIGHTWFGTGDGISEFDGPVWTTYTAKNAREAIGAVAKDEDRHIRVVTEEGSRDIRIEFDRQAWVMYGYGVSSTVYLYPLTPAGEATKWTSGDGVNKLDGQTQTNYNYDDGLVSNHITAIAIDHAGHKWFGSDRRGVSEFIEGGVSPAVPAPPATATVFIPPQPAAAPTPTAPDPKTGPLPAVIARIKLAPDGRDLGGLMLDEAAGRLYVTDDTGQLHVLDTATLRVVAAFPHSGLPTPDPAHRRLYVPGEGNITVRDAASLEVTGTISPGGRIVLDNRHNRLYVDNRIYDASTLQALGEWPGEFSSYNPLRGEEFSKVGFVNDQAISAIDLDSKRVTADLLPDISASVYFNMTAGSPEIFPERNVIMAQTWLHVAGHGSGRDIPPRFFDATTLDEFADLGQQPPTRVDCDRQIVFSQPVDGRVYRQEFSQTYDAYYNLMVYDLNGQVVTWHDGLGLGLINPATRQMYWAGRAFDLDTLSPLGTLPVWCIDAVDASTGHLYARDEGSLVVFSEHGRWPDAPPPDSARALPTGQVTYIQASPDYVHDRTIFLGTGPVYGHFDALYRSTDEGQTWRRLRGGLPDTTSWGLAISPNFARDHTLFVGGNGGTYRGEGVYRSTDGGDTWQPMWNGLAHLRVEDMAISPNYAADGTVFAYATYFRIYPHARGISLFRSADRGATWTLIDTSEYSALPAPEELISSGSPLATRFYPAWHRLDNVPMSTGYSRDGGHTWQPVTITDTRQARVFLWVAFPSPNFDADQTIYAFSSTDLYRSTDGGDTWEYWADKQMAGLAVSVSSPLLKDGSYRLFLGTAAGEFWTLDPRALRWEAVPGGAK